MEALPRKKVRGNVTDESSAEESAKVSGKCTGQDLTYDVLRIIFKNLNGMELSSAAMVSRSWLEAANNEKRTRGPTHSIEHLTEHITMGRVKTQIIKQLRIKPVLGLFFPSNRIPLFETDCHCKVLPPNCNTITLGTYGIVIDNLEIENGVDEIVCAFLPEIPDVTIKTFAFGEKTVTEKNQSNSVDKYSEEIKQFLSTPQKNSGISKCLLLFCVQRGRVPAIKITSSLKRCYAADELSVWGGVARELLVCNAKDKKNRRCGEFSSCVAVALVGAMNTWSIVVDKHCKTKELIEQRLRTFKSHTCLKKHSIGFMFACCARGQSMFKEWNVESSIFKKLFPEVPLVGCFGDGEFGENSLPNESSRKKRTWYHETTTIFLIITYG
ncbi:F-box only protein 22-like [Hylaeus anthracinus]|uniref:F-box only protein 22-like n=1 Tax=Hylaeus volcanicus TaxID=313075 RepID=UPI0023B8048E|nr:F-box only protein 22-like [Hylaeus volcanicus]XP_054003185.1 F-box only protein 22-like [Hylaeus anthracinus]